MLYCIFFVFLYARTYLSIYITQHILRLYIHVYIFICCHVTERSWVQVLETTSCVKNRVRLCTIHQNGGTPSWTLRMQ